MAVKGLKVLPRFWTIGKPEYNNLVKAMKGPLSGYVGGNNTGGPWVTRLAKEWESTFNVERAIPCNSATSGLLAACMATGIASCDTVYVSSYTMSATATCAMALGAKVKFLDVDHFTFNMNLTDFAGTPPKAIIVTNLFGHPAKLLELRTLCDKHGVIMIEDNAQAPFAMIGSRYAGTIGHIGVFSLNVHKHLQCGEGGIIVSNDHDLADRAECAINHGELNPAHRVMGLNLRMTEPIAAIACAQLKKGEQIVQGRIELAEALTETFSSIPFVKPPIQEDECRHVYYMWAARFAGRAEERKRFVGALVERGIPLRIGYSIPLHRLFKTGDECPTVEALEDESLFSFEICAYDMKRHHLRRLKDIVHEVSDGISQMEFPWAAQ